MPAPRINWTDLVTIENSLKNIETWMGSQSVQELDIIKRTIITKIIAYVRSQTSTKDFLSLLKTAVSSVTRNENRFPICDSILSMTDLPVLPFLKYVDNQLNTMNDPVGSLYTSLKKFTRGHLNLLMVPFKQQEHDAAIGLFIISAAILLGYRSDVGMVALLMAGWYLFNENSRTEQRIQNDLNNRLYENGVQRMQLGVTPIEDGLMGEAVNSLSAVALSGVRQLGVFARNAVGQQRQLPAVNNNNRHLPPPDYNTLRLHR